MAINSPNSPETRGLSPEEIARLQQATEREVTAQEFLDAQEQGGQPTAKKLPFPSPEANGFDNVKTRLNQIPAPEAIEDIAGLGPNPTHEEKLRALNRLMSTVGTRGGISPDNAIRGLEQIQDLADRDHEKAA